MEKILLDTDIGGDIDDAICLAYLLKEPQCELLGITTVCGEPEKRAAVADAICRTVGKMIPIVAGLDTTLQPIPVYPTPDGVSALEHWPHNTYEKADAPGFLYQKIKENPHEIVLIGIGNMTNIATLFCSYPDAQGLLKGLYVMNGYFGVDPLPEPCYNWNSWADPLASKIVFASHVANHQAFPLEVTDMLTIDARRARTLLRADTDLMKAVLDFGSAWLESAGKLTLHDPLVAVSIFHPDICSFEKGTCPGGNGKGKQYGKYDIYSRSKRKCGDRQNCR
ncbi:MULTISPECIES: nucleoside hydrolase [Paenibacillus]|uniref:nucleoside hydrolase n=1 Tax=Paenibacillus TaxID=44249 RepID=UPI001B03365A|nr:nucleoside hydrolase [Paenibacillus lactis]GIO90321.1 nucleoside hydrolase [Paenibacillus lactis]